MAVGSITHPFYASANFLVMSTPTGWPVDQFNAEEEELRSPGVDGKRWRTTSIQHMPITMTTVMDSTTYNGCILLARFYRLMKTGDPVVLAVTLAGTTYRFRNVHIVDVNPQVSAGAVYGAGATASSAAHVICTWQLILMDPASTGEIG